MGDDHKGGVESSHVLYTKFLPLESPHPARARLPHSTSQYGHILIACVVSWTVLLNCGSTFSHLSFFTSYPFSVPRDCLQVVPVSPELWRVLRCPLFWQFRGITGEHPPARICLMLSSWSDGTSGFGKEDRRCKVSFSLCPIEGTSWWC